MKKLMTPLILLLFLPAAISAQINQTKASFKQESLAEFLSKDFNKRIRGTKVPNGQVVLSFTITKDGEVKDPFPENFKNKTLALNALLAVQATNTLWSPCLINGSPIDKKYKILFNFVSAEKDIDPRYSRVKTYLDAGKYERALDILDNMIEQNIYVSLYYYNRAVAKKNLNDVEGFKNDSIKANELQDEVLAEVNILTKGEIKVVERIIMTTETKRVVTSQNRN